MLSYRRIIFSAAWLNLSICILISLPSAAWSFDDPTKGEPFFPWLWNEQIKPTAREALDTEGFGILAGTAALTITARQYDSDVRIEYGNNRHMPPNISAVGSVLGSGGPAILIATGLLAWDQPEGLKLARTMVFTAASHITLASIAGRRRPNDGPRSFPSGHSSSAFAVAGSLAYSYGPWVGVPALALATFVGASRIADNAHWLSDTVAAAGLGLFWARASAHADQDRGSLRPVAPAVVPVLLPGGLALSFTKDF